MSRQQITGLVVLLLGVAALIVSIGTAWTLSLRPRIRRVQGAGFIIFVVFLLFLVGNILCYYGVSSLVGA